MGEVIKPVFGKQLSVVSEAKVSVASEDSDTAIARLLLGDAEFARQGHAAIDFLRTACKKRKRSHRVHFQYGKFPQKKMKVWSYGRIPSRRFRSRTCAPC